MPKKKKKTDNLTKIVLLALWGLFFLGFALMGFAEQYPIVWRYSMFLNTPNLLVIVSILVSGCFIYPLHRSLKRNLKQSVNVNPNHAIIMIDLMVGFIILFIFTQLGIILNGVPDKSIPQEISTTVVDKRAYHNLKDISSWYLDLQDWDNPNRSIQFRVDKPRYESTRIGDVIQVGTKSGFLGYEWVTNDHQIETGSP